MTVPASPAAVSAERVLALAAETLDIEAKALLGLKPKLGDSMVAAVRAVLACSGRLVVMGMGKSGHVGRKIAATLASTGTPAMFVHPGEASHGDLGMVTPSDIVLAISNSGESDELNVIVPVLKRLGTPLIAMTGNPGSSLAVGFLVPMFGIGMNGLWASRHAAFGPRPRRGGDSGEADSGESAVAAGAIGQNDDHG